MHCKDTILRTQNNWPYSKLIPNSGQISYLLGHESIQTTMVYLDITTKQEEKALETLEGRKSKENEKKVEDRGRKSKS